MQTLPPLLIGGNYTLLLQIYSSWKNLPRYVTVADGGRCRCDFTYVVPCLLFTPLVIDSIGACITLPLPFIPTL